MVDPSEVTLNSTVLCPRCQASLSLDENTLERDGAPLVVCPRCGFEFEPPPDPPDVLLAALEYALMGYPVLPLKPGGKEPHPVLGGRGLTAASRNFHVLEAWFLDRPEANLGIAVPERVVVFDFDNREELHAFLARYKSLQDAPRSLTPRGAHVWVAVPEGVKLRSKPSKLLPQFEVKKPGRSYVVEHPSRVGGAPYVWEVPLRPPHELPLIPPTLLSALTVDPWTEWAGAASKSKEDFDHVLHTFEAAAIPGNRHNALLKAAARLVSRGAPPEYIVKLKKLAKRSGLTGKEIKDVFRWVFKNVRLGGVQNG